MNSSPRPGDKRKPGKMVAIDEVNKVTAGHNRRSGPGLNLRAAQFRRVRGTSA